MNMILAIAAGGALGSVLRYMLSGFTTGVVDSSFPWGTLSVNILGSFFMGAVVTHMALAWNPSVEVRAFLTVGLLGGFTTFSAFSLDAFQLWERGALGEMIGYVLASVVLSIVGLVLGVMVIKQVMT